MSRNTKWMVGLSLAVVMTVGARAQETAPDAAGAPMHGPGGPMHGPGFGGPFGDRMELLGFGGVHGRKTVTGAPFSAVAVGESKQTLSDGTVISRKFQSNLYRDAQGRIRREVTVPALGPLAAGGTPKSFVVIHDPVAQTAFVLEPDQKIARKLPVHGNGGPGQDAAAAPHHPDSTNVTKESLGTQTINGVSAEGTRYTRTIPAGQIGNDRPLTIVKEEWYSPDLQMVVQSKHSDPFMGDTTYSVTNIQRTAPNANLFAVPADYTVKDAPPDGAGRRHGMRHQGGAPANAPAGPGND